MFKKLQDWLFKEDFEELDIEDKENYIDEVVYEEMKRKEEPKRRESSEFENRQSYVKPTETKMNINITVDDPVVEIKKEVKETKAATNKSRLTLTRKEEYEMPPVISPYFGVKGEDALQTKENAPTLTSIHTNQKKETFNSVISPFYGQKHSQKPIQQTRTKTTHDKVESNLESKVNETVVSEVESKYDEDNISLDEIVSTQKNNADDLIQFSLFGDNKRIQEEEFD
ncbi:MAG: hypothetical protein EOM50_18980, partial [Erysipelotrichia bacterium]|nr:hypothetical protein [Erysipelotrichia bacterium]